MASRSPRLHDRAEVGVGTLIVFIAMVLVAAVAAAVIINTTGVLQGTAQQTGREATQDVSSNLKVINIYGIRALSTDATLWDINLNTELAAGSANIDMTKVLIRWSDGSTVRTYTHDPAGLANGAAASAHFEATWIRGTGGSPYVMQTGDIVQIHFNNAQLAPRTDIQLQLTPGTGSPVSADFRSVPTYGSDTTITLR